MSAFAGDCFELEGARAGWGSPPVTSSLPGRLFPRSMTVRGRTENISAALTRRQIGALPLILRGAHDKVLVLPNCLHNIP